MATTPMSILKVDGQEYEIVDETARAELKTTKTTLTISNSDFTYYDTRPMYILRYGNVCTLYGCIKNTSDWNSQGETHIATIPTGLRPPMQYCAVMQGSGNYRFLLIIQPDGRITISRYAGSGSTSSWEAETVPSGAWINLFATWVIE